LTSRVSTKAGISQLAIRVPERNSPVITFALRSFSYRIGTIFREAESMIEYAHAAKDDIRTFVDIAMYISIPTRWNDNVFSLLMQK